MLWRLSARYNRTLRLHCRHTKTTCVVAARSSSTAADLLVGLWLAALLNPPTDQRDGYDEPVNF